MKVTLEDDPRNNQTLVYITTDEHILLGAVPIDLPLSGTEFTNWVCQRMSLLGIQQTTTLKWNYGLMLLRPDRVAILGDSS